MTASLKILVLAAVVALLASCQGQKFLTTNQSGNLIDVLNTDTAIAHFLAPDDKLTLSIWNHDDLSIGSVFSIYNSNEAFGKWLLIDDEGNVDLPKIGKVHLAGLTAKQASDSLSQVFGNYITNPIVVLKVINRKVSVMGEVTKPGNYLLEEQVTTITELIGMAEGYTDYSNLKHVQLVRDSISYRINLRRMSPQMLQNIPLQANDIVIVPAKRGKTIDQKAPTLIPFSSALTALVLVISILR